MRYLGAISARMKNRTLVYLVALAALIGIGIWIAYQGVVAPTRVGPLMIDIDLAAMYWFALLIYGIVGLILYYPLRGRSWPTLLIGHGFAIAIALVSTVTVVALGHQRAPARADVPVENVDADDRMPDSADPSAQPLPLPPIKDSFAPRARQSSAMGYSGRR